MKILLATQNVTANSGVPSFNRELANLLANDNEIHLLVDEDINSFSIYKKVYSIYGKNIYNYQFCFELINQINGENYDIIINSKSYIMSLLAPFLNNDTKLITVSHSLGTMDCDNAVFNNKYIDKIIALSHSCKDHILNRFTIRNSDKISVVFNSVESCKNACDMRSSKLKTDVLKIVFAGGSAPSKSPELVVPILHELCKSDLSFEFYWLGDKTPPLKKFQPYQDISLVLPNDKRIIITGRIPQKEASEIIASCNVFLAPSKREGFPMALLEAMRIGCIPIVSDYEVANKEIIKDRVNGFVIPHDDIAGFANRLIDILKNHSKYSNIYKECYNTFVNELSFPVWRKNIYTVIVDDFSSHVKRKKITFFRFKYNALRFWLLYKYDNFEMQFKESLPSAYIFYKYYKKYARG